METKTHKTLQETGNRNPFAVPENYFEDFAAGIDERVASKKLTLRKLLKPWMYMAAMFVGVFLMGNIFYTLYQQNKKQDVDLYDIYVMSQIDQSVVFDYYDLSETPGNE
jgi:hypothetical protein